MLPELVHLWHWPPSRPPKFLRLTRGLPARQQRFLAFSAGHSSNSLNYLDPAVGQPTDLMNCSPGVGRLVIRTARKPCFMTSLTLCTVSCVYLNFLLPALFGSIIRSMHFQLLVFDHDMSLNKYVALLSSICPISLQLETSLW